MTKQHSFDNKLLNELKTKLRQGKNVESQLQSGLTIGTVNESKSLFELSHQIRLGRTATRELVKSSLKRINEQLSIDMEAEKNKESK